MASAFAATAATTAVGLIASVESRLGDFLLRQLIGLIGNN